MKRTCIVALAAIVFGIAASAFFVVRLASERVDVSQTIFHLLKVRIQEFVLDTGTLPTTLDELIYSDRASWNGPYAKDSDLIDPWKLPIRYEVVDPQKFEFKLVLQGHLRDSTVSERTMERIYIDSALVRSK